MYCMIISLSIYIYDLYALVFMYIIHTESRVFTGFKDQDKKTEEQPRFFIEAL